MLLFIGAIILKYLVLKTKIIVFSREGWSLCLSPLGKRAGSRNGSGLMASGDSPTPVSRGHAQLFLYIQSHHIFHVDGLRKHVYRLHRGDVVLLAKDF